MTRRRITLLVACGLLWGGFDVARGVSADQEAGATSYITSTTAILVDVVVRDRQGRPVTDLQEEDFELFEDGVQQTVGSFARVTRGGGIGIGVRWREPAYTAFVSGRPAAAPEPADPGSPPDEATTALLFDHLSADALALAQRATLDYVPASGDAEGRVAVFATNPGLAMLQPYTTDRAAIREAVRRVLPAGTSAAEDTSERRDLLMQRRRELTSELQSAAAGAAGGTAPAAQAGGQIGAREQELRLIEIERSMIDSLDSIDRDYRGYDTTISLTAVIRSMLTRPGRKSIVYFSEGLPVSPVLSARLNSVIDAANRANVTVYAIDARGLRTSSSLAETRKEMQEFAEQRLADLATPGTRADRSILRNFERVEDTLHLESRTGLARLAGDTGGFLVDGSNDLSAAFRRIDEDNQFHYLLTYVPHRPLGDGRFRTIRVKVQRPGVKVFSRKGYRAIVVAPTPHTIAHEAPALEMLNRTPLPNAFPIGAAGFSFPDPERPGVVPIAVRLSTESLRFDLDQGRSSYLAQVAVVVRVTDGDGHDVHTLSQEYVMSGDANDVEAARRGEILFYREPDLPPGVYTLEAIALDTVANVASVRTSTLTVPPAETSRLGMSSLVLVARTEEVADVAAEDGTSSPLYVGRTLLYPNLGEPISKSARELPFYFALYGDVTQVTEASVQLLKQGQPIAEGPLRLPEASGTRLQHVGRLPIEPLPEGTYELRVRVASSQDELSRTAFFTLQE